MTSLEHFKKIADSFLEADDDLKEWLSLPALRRAWHLFFGILFVRLLSIIMEPTIAGCFNSVERGVFICRLVDTLLAISIEAIILLLAFEYYKYILNKKSNVCLSIIITIYCISTIVCGSIYRDIYLLDTGQFIYHDPPFVPLPTLDPSHGLEKIKMFLQFLMFSGFQSLNALFYRIQANSILVSCIIFIQSLFTYALITLFIASYVTENANRKQRQS